MISAQMSGVGISTYFEREALMENRYHISEDDCQRILKIAHSE
jgi:hypothetical protein